MILIFGCTNLSSTFQVKAVLWYTFLHFRRRLAFTKTPATMGKGEITEQLATLLKSLWSLQYDPEISDKFKSLVDKYGSQYKGL